MIDRKKICHTNCLWEDEIDEEAKAKEDKDTDLGNKQRRVTQDTNKGGEQQWVAQDTNKGGRTKHNT